MARYHVWTKSEIRKKVSATIARRRLRELRHYYGSIAAMQHNIFQTTGYRADRTSFYGWLAGVRCPDGRVTRLGPPPLYSMTKWMQGHDGLVPSNNKEPFVQEDWWTPVSGSNYKLQEIPDE